MRSGLVDDHGLNAPLQPLPDLTDKEWGYNPPNITSVILFRQVDPGVSALLADIRAPDDAAGLIDFGRVVPIPADLPEAWMRRWGEENWGVDHNAGGAELVDRFGYRGIGFFTEAPPIPVLEALAAKHPDVAWNYYACAWQLCWFAKGEAGGGKFTMREVNRQSGDETKQIQTMCFGS